jgi:predicted O-linked N-acetylglucosamine transferase (SPINDLY family)
MSDIILQSAWRQHQAGNLAEAERLYRQVLLTNPRHAGALQLLGFLHFQRGEFGDAERVMDKAIKLNPQSVDALYNRGCALQALDRHKDALTCFDRALALKSDYAPAMLNRGNTLSQMGRFEDALTSYDLAAAMMPASAEVPLNRGNVLFELKRYPEALASYEAALARDAKHPLIWNNRGNVQGELGRHQDALASYGRALQLEPGYADALINRAQAFEKLERYDEALADYDRVRTLEPDNVEALYGRGHLLSKRNRNDEALACFDRVLALDETHAEAAIERGVILIDRNEPTAALAAFDHALRHAPDNTDALSNRASVLLRLKRFDEALACADRALAVDPDYSAAWHNRGSALAGLKQHNDAIAAYDRALAIAPDNPVTWNNRGGAMLSLKQDEAALPYFERALQLGPADPNIWSNRAHAFSALKRLPEAIADAEQALALDPNHASAQRMAFHCRLHTCDWSRRDDDKRRITAGLEAGSRVVNTLDHRGLGDSEREHLIAAALFAAEEFPPASHPLWRGERYRHDKIRLAYLSTDFRAHAVASLIVGIFEHHDKTRFETTAISFSPDDRSETRQRIETAFDRFIDVQNMSDSEAAAIMRESEIDIAIDLNGYTGDSRAGILAFRPAPVQVNYLGYPGTMGAPYIDYLIADRMVIPPEHRMYQSEKVAYLPYAYQANDRNRRIGDTPTRSEASLPETGFVFSCFNNTYKIGPEIFDIWMRLIRDVEGSVLWLLEDNAIAATNLRREAQARGVDPERLIFASRKLPHEHLARQRLADLFLDTQPYNAHTTASDALWMGLPLVTCPGNTFPARVAASLLHAIGMPELVTSSPIEYERLALKLARQPDTLAAIRAKIIANRDTQPMFDTASFAKDLERIYATMWERQQSGLPPESFGVDPATAGRGPD